MDPKIAAIIGALGWVACTPRPPPVTTGPAGGPAMIAASDEPTYAGGHCGAPVPVGGKNVLWAVHIGHTTYRSTLHVTGGQVIVGSNGDAWHATEDPCDGVYILSASSGKLVRHIATPDHPAGGESDVTGVAVTADALIFGTDQGVLFKTDRAGKVVWSYSMGGDVEAAPVVADVDGDGVGDVAAGAELGDFFVISGATGKVLHRIATGEGDYGQRGFVTAAAAGDVTGDGVADFFAPGRDGTMRAIDGKSGAILWRKKHTSALHSAPILVDTDGDKKLELLYAAVYSELLSVDAATGDVRWQAELSHPGLGIEGLFSPVAYFPAARCAVVGTAWWKKDEGVYCVRDGDTLWRFDEPTENITSGAVIGDVDGAAGSEVVFATESGWVFGLDARGNKVWDFHAGSPIEMTPTVADVDGDGLNEVLIAAQDGILRAVVTDGHAPAEVGYFRGDAKNTGVWPVPAQQ